MHLPKISAPRGGVVFTPLASEQQRRRDEQIRALTERGLEQFAQAREMTINAAVYYAAQHGYDVHVFEPPQLLDIRHISSTNMLRQRCVGIEFTPTRYGMPTVHFHPCSGDDFDWEMAWEEDDLEHWI